MTVFTARRWSAMWLLAAVATVQAQTSPPPVPAASEAGTTFKRWDKNSDGTLSATEFSAGWQEIQTANTLRKLHDNFVAKDVDRNGSLGASEYLELDLIRKAGTSAPSMARFDTDKNQALDFKEYVGMVSALLQPAP